MEKSIACRKPSLEEVRDQFEDLRHTGKNRQEPIPSRLKLISIWVMNFQPNLFILYPGFDVGQFFSESLNIASSPSTEVFII